MALNKEQAHFIKNIRDEGKSQFPYPIDGETGDLQAHHIEPQSLGGKDDPLNLLSLDTIYHPGTNRTVEMGLAIHPDIVEAKKLYRFDKNAFKYCFANRNRMIEQGDFSFYNRAFDEEMRAIAFDRTETAALNKQFFPRKNPDEYFRPDIDPHVVEMVLLQHEQRKNWQQNDTLEVVDQMIFHELAELDEAVQKAYIGGGAFEVASEIGDLGYLYIRRSQFHEPLTYEISTALEYAHYVCTATGIDMNQAIMMKCIRNDMKYVHTFTNNGYGYDKSVQLSKAQWRAMGGDYAFSEMYLEVGEDL